MIIMHKQQREGQNFRVQDRFVHGSSFAIHMDSVDFLTWRMNEDTGQLTREDVVFCIQNWWRGRKDKEENSNQNVR